MYLKVNKIGLKSTLTIFQINNFELLNFNAKSPQNHTETHTSPIPKRNEY